MRSTERFFDISIIFSSVEENVFFSSMHNKYFFHDKGIYNIVKTVSREHLLHFTNHWPK